MRARPATAPPAAESAAPAPVSLPTWWRDLTAWDDPVMSGTVFCVVNVAFYVTVLNRWSAASLFGALSLYGLLCAAVAVAATRLLRSTGYPPVGAVLDAACDALPAMLRQPGDAALLDVEIAAEVGRRLASGLNSGIEAVRLLATLANPLATAGALLGALLLKSFGKHVGVLGLLWAAFVVAYAWPAAQSSFGAQLEELRDQALAAPDRERSARFPLHGCPSTRLRPPPGEPALRSAGMLLRRSLVALLGPELHPSTATGSPKLDGVLINFHESHGLLNSS